MEAIGAMIGPPGITMGLAGSAGPHRHRRSYASNVSTGSATSSPAASVGGRVSLARRLRALASVMPRGRENRSDLARYLLRRPALLVAMATYETAAVVSGQAPPHLKGLATLKTSALIGCPF